jgi:hypothetical protein
MYTLDAYNKHIHLLTNSLVIKLSDVGIGVNLGLLKRYNIDESSSNKNSWKYYLNLAGIKHSTNTAIINIATIEDGLTRLLTPAMLDKYPSTREELLKYSNYYKELINTYPDDYSYINGCIQPVDIATSINAKDGDILAYNKSLVEYNEFSLIRNLENYIKNYLARWNVVDYMLTDELYLPTLLGVMYSGIVNKISTLRLNKVYTSEVHSFHMEHFFRSQLDLWDNLSGLNNSSKFWLYKNLRYLIKHTGSEETLNSLLTNVFDNNGIGIGEHILFKTDPVLDINNSENLLLPAYNSSKIKFMGQNKNLSYHYDNNSELDIENIVSLELSDISIDVAHTQKEKSHIAKNATNEINISAGYKQKTKVLDINVPQLFKNHSEDIITALMDNWLYRSKHDAFETKEIYLEPNTKTPYTLTPYQGYLMLLYFLLKLVDNKETVLSTINVRVLKPILTKDLLLSNLFNKTDISTAVDDILLAIPTEEQAAGIKDKKSYNVYFNKIIDLYKFIWAKDSNANNPVNSANIKIVSNRLFTNIDVSLTAENLTITKLLKNNDIVVKESEAFDVIAAINSLFLTFTGVDINTYSSIESSNKNYIDIINKLTSYTVHVINAVDNSKTTYVPYTNDSIFKSSYGLIAVTETKFETLEQNFTHINSSANNIDSEIKNYCFTNIPSALIYTKEPAGVMELRYQKDDLAIQLFKPSMTAEVIDW